jgi:hypothetical protein
MSIRSWLLFGILSAMSSAGCAVLFLVSINAVGFNG